MFSYGFQQSSSEDQKIFFPRCGAHGEHSPGTISDYFIPKDKGLATNIGSRVAAIRWESDSFLTIVRRVHKRGITLPGATVPIKSITNKSDHDTRLLFRHLGWLLKIGITMLTEICFL